jgi:hypothetical protein
MPIRIRETGEIQTKDQFERFLRNNNVSVPEGALTPEIMDAHGADPVTEGPQPTGEAWQRVEPDGVENVGGQWRTKWKLVPDSLDENGLEAQRQLKLSALAAQRWTIETGGITFAGLPIKTDEDTQRKITGAYVQATRNPSMTVKWKVAPATFMTLDADTIIAIGDAVTAHIQSAFDHESDLIDAIMSATNWSELQAVDIGAGW